MYESRKSISFSLHYLKQISITYDFQVHIFEFLMFLLWWISLWSIKTLQNTSLTWSIYGLHVCNNYLKCRVKQTSFQEIIICIWRDWKVCIHHWQTLVLHTTGLSHNKLQQSGKYVAAGRRKYWKVHSNNPIH